MHVAISSAYDPPSHSPALPTAASPWRMQIGESATVRAAGEGPIPRRRISGVTRPRIVLVGCSFAGLEFLYRYVRRRGGRLAPGELTVIEPRSQHPYVPLAHEAASGASAPESLRFDIETLCASVGAGFV